MAYKFVNSETWHRYLNIEKTKQNSRNLPSSNKEQTANCKSSVTGTFEN